jgi:hypothetical protein
MRLFQVLTAIGLIAVAPLRVLAAPQDAVMNKEGYWGIDVDNGACAASMTLQGGAVFLLRAQEGQVTFGLFAPKPLPRGKAGRIETEAYGFDFKPSYGEDAITLYYADNFDARALAALRLAKQARILVDGRMVTAMTLEGTGFEGALDGVIACSNGQSGWWGKGVGAGSAAVDDAEAPPLHKDGFWMAATIESTPGVCVGTAKVDDEYAFSIIVGQKAMSFGVTGTKDMRRGRKGRLQTDAYSADFRPAYDGSNYLYPAADLDSQAAFALRRARTVVVSVDGKALVDMAFEGTGYAEVLSDLAACAAGEKGWWGEGAKAP